MWYIFRSKAHSDCYLLAIFFLFLPMCPKDFLSVLLPLCVQSTVSWSVFPSVLSYNLLLMTQTLPLDGLSCSSLIIIFKLH